MRHAKGEWPIKNFGARNKLEPTRRESNVPKVETEHGGESGTGKRITATNEKVLIGHAARRPPPETKAVTAEAALKDHPYDPDIMMSHLADDTGTDVVIIGEKTMLDQVYLIVVNQGPTVSQSEISDEPEKKTNSNETNIDFNQLFSLASKEDPETDTATEKNVKANAKIGYEKTGQCKWEKTKSI